MASLAEFLLVVRENVAILTLLALHRGDTLVILSNFSRKLEVLWLPLVSSGDVNLSDDWSGFATFNLIREKANKLSLMARRYSFWKAIPQMFSCQGCSDWCQSPIFKISQNEFEAQLDKMLLKFSFNGFSERIQSTFNSPPPTDVFVNSKTSEANKTKFLSFENLSLHQTPSPFAKLSACFITLLCVYQFRWSHLSQAHCLPISRTTFCVIRA